MGQIRQVEDDAFGFGVGPLHFEIKHIRHARRQILPLNRTTAPPEARSTSMVR